MHLRVVRQCPREFQRGVREPALTVDQVPWLEAAVAARSVAVAAVAIVKSLSKLAGKPWVPEYRSGGQNRAKKKRRQCSDCGHLGHYAGGGCKATAAEKAGNTPRGEIFQTRTRRL